MKEGLRLKIGKHWCVLGPSPSISIEMTSPLWNKSGSFSYTFEVPYSTNRHIFNAAEMPESDVNLKRFRERFELYVEGIGLLFGDAICSSDEIDERKDKVDIELRSGNATFEDAIEGKNLRDLDLSDVEMGTIEEYSMKWYALRVEDQYGNIIKQYTNKLWNSKYHKFEERLQIEQYIYKSIITNHNDVYVNIPIIVNGVKNKDSNNKHPLVLSAWRDFSAPCFTMMYILKRMFKYIKIKGDIDSLLKVEDMQRIIFINAAFKYDYGKTISESSTEKDSTEFHSYNSFDGYTWHYVLKGYEHRKLSYILPTSENLPDITFSDVIDALKSAFGIRTIADETRNSITFVFLKDVFCSKDIETLRVKDIISINKKHQSFAGIKVAYNTADGDEYSYSDYKMISLFDKFDSLLSYWKEQKDSGDKDLYGNPLIESDTVLKITQDTGNYYRTKVDKSKNEEAQLFEVAQFLPYEVKGDAGAEEEPEEIVINFNPVITTGINNFDTIRNIQMPKEAIFIEADVEWNSKEGIIDAGPITGFTNSYDAIKSKKALDSVLSADLGFTIGVMRSTPDSEESEGGYTTIRSNVDGFGNDEWAQTLSVNAVTCDSISREGYIYDYNGSSLGTGTPMENYICLKLWANKQNFNPKNLTGLDDSGKQITGADVYNNNPTGPLPNRGLVPQFLSEYLYFMKHRKPLEFVLEMEVADIANIKWQKYYKIAGYRLLIDKISFDVTNNGIGLVTMNVYCI